MKKILLILTILLLTGCNCDYEVELNSKTVKENIKIDIQNSELEDYSEDASIGDDASFLIDTDINPLIGNEDVIYDKEVNDTNYGKEIILKHAFTSDDYKKLSYFLNTCFENTHFEYRDGAYEIKLSGYFYCLYGDEVNIKVKSNNLFKSANGKKDGTNYSWTIDKSNYENVDISLQISDESKVRNYIYIIIAIIAGIVIFGFIIYYVGIFLGKDDVNSI